MIYPEGDAIKDRIRNRYSLVVLAAKRARQLKEGAPALIDTQSPNALTVALEEIAAGKINFIEGVEHRRDDESPSHEADPASLEDAFLAPVDTKPAAPAISEELAAFMDSPAETSIDDEIEADDEDASDDEAESEDDEAESHEPNEEAEA